MLQRPEFEADLCEGGPRIVYRCYTPSVGGVWHPQVHRSCAHNMVAGLQLRTMAPVPEPTPEGISSFGYVGRLLRNLLRDRVGQVEPWSRERVVASYTEKRLRVRYGEALRSLSEEGLCTRKDSDVKAFVKGELLNYKVFKPRVIMARSPRYNLELAAFLKPIEHAVYGELRGFGPCFTRTRLVGKGLSGEERAKLLRRKWTSRPDLVAFEVDCKSFESHVRGFQLDMEHRVYSTLTPSPRLRELLRWQKKFEGKGTGGVRFELEGVRASGDFNTGLGNTLIMCCLVLMVSVATRTGFDFLADGDNAVIFIRKKDLPLWREELPRVFLSAGHEAELGDVCESFSEITFGQSKPIKVGGVWRMIRDPLKILSQSCAGFKHYVDMRGGRRVLKSVAYCEAVLSAGVPVLQAFSQSLLKALEDVSFSKAVLDNFEYQRILSRGVQWARARKQVITPETRILFARSWGICIEEQLRLERILSVVPNIPRTWTGTQVAEESPDGRDYWSLPQTWLGSDRPGF